MSLLFSLLVSARVIFNPFFLLLVCSLMEIEWLNFCHFEPFVILLGYYPSPEPTLDGNYILVR